MKLIFCLQLNVKVFYKLIVSSWVYVACHSQSTHNDKFAISLQYLNENVKDEIDFYLQIKIKGTFKLILSFYVCGMPNLPKITSLLFLWYMSINKWMMKLIFYMHISMKSFLQTDAIIFDGDWQAFPKFPK